jgi:predicted Zn-dependent protease with MMP-like domain
MEGVSTMDETTMDKTVTIDVTIQVTHAYEGVQLSMRRLLDLIGEHMPDRLTDAVGAILDDAVQNTDEYAEFLTALTRESGVVPEDTVDDVASLGHDL